MKRRVLAGILTLTLCLSCMPCYADTEALPAAAAEAAVELTESEDAVAEEVAEEVDEMAEEAAPEETVAEEITAEDTAEVTEETLSEQTEAEEKEADMSDWETEIIPAGSKTGVCGPNLTYSVEGDADHYKLVISGTGAMYDFPGPQPWYPYAVKELEIAEGVTTIGAGAFKDTAITKVTLPVSVTAIGQGAFSISGHGIDDVFYGGTDEDWNKISISPDNTALLSSTIHMKKVGVDITQQPQNVSAGVNATVSFSVIAENAVSYQWQYSKNGGAKWINCSATGNKTDAISLKVTTSNAVNIYRCIVTGEKGQQVISESAGVELLPGAVITLNPKSNAVAVGEYATFTVETENAAAFQWQYSKDGAHWYRSGAEGNQTDTLIVKGEQKSQGNRYRCVVTGIDGNTKKSFMAAMIVMTVAPKTCTAAVGETASYSLKAEGIASYQWQYSKDNGASWYKSSATGAETDTVSFKATATNRAMIYRCKLTTPDEAYAFTKPVGFAEGMKITAQPVNVTAAAGDTVSFKVAATNVASYQWQYSKDGNTWNKSGAAGNTTDTIQLTVTASNKANVYRCKLTGADGSVQYTNAVGVK